MTDCKDGDAHPPSDQAQSDNQTATNEVSRRKAFGRFVGYTAPAMLALLASMKHATASTTS